MPAIYSKCGSNKDLEKDTTMDGLLRLYLKVLDGKQRDVDAIRKMHHEVWKESRVYPIIKQHRSGSRVEKQLRISQVGKQSDIDYTFEVTGVEISCSNDIKSSMYWKTSSMSNAYGKIFVTSTYKDELQSMEYHAQIFTDDVFLFDDEENNFLLIPKAFKENVVKVSGFDYRKEKTTEKTVKSPSIPGQGAINEYDVVPCLRLKEWPSTAAEWSQRSSDQNKISVFDRKWKEKIAESVPLFIVPTGNPGSDERDHEFRLSFSQVEIKCFDHVTTQIRKYYGLGKYLFKTILGSDDIMASYHAKTILLWMAEEKSTIEWEAMNPHDFVNDFFERINAAVESETINHYFVTNCNIFPTHKFTFENLLNHKEKMVKLSDQILSNTTQLLKYDLKLQGTEASIISSGLEALKREDLSNAAYVRGYLTRLLSVITFSLYENENQDTLDVAIYRIRNIFQSYREEKHIGRIIPMVNATLTRMYLDGRSSKPLNLHEIKMDDVDSVSEKAHLAFEAYCNNDIETARAIINTVKLSEYKPNGFGVSITSYHKGKLDQQLNFIVTALERESKNGKAPRFYMDPFLLTSHLRIQLNSIEKRDIDKLTELLQNLEIITEKLSEKEPYLGKLSYKFSGIYLLHGYKCHPMGDLMTKLALPDKYPLGSFNQRMFAGNFDLR